ncbi:MAG: hypothetical protein ACOC9Q_01255, partial [bacterium]
GLNQDFTTPAMPTFSTVSPDGRSRMCLNGLPVSGWMFGLTPSRFEVRFVAKCGLANVKRNRRCNTLGSLRRDTGPIAESASEQKIWLTSMQTLL